MNGPQEVSEAAHRIQESARSYGNKAANLIALQDILVNNVPDFCPLADLNLQAHLDKYSGTWRGLLLDFQNAQGEGEDISPEASIVLSALREEIMRTFKEHSLDDAKLVDFLNAIQQKDPSATFMVRSTGEEDTIDLANPGGNESIAAVAPNIQSISDAMGRVIASYFSEKSLKQRLLSKSDITKDVFIPVLIQKMIGEPINGCGVPEQAVRSGVMYTGQAFTRIQVAPGHGELVVNSKGLFDTFSVTRENIVYPEIRLKQYRLIPSDDGLQLTENTKNLQKSASISPDVAQKLTAMGREIEAYYGMPMDVEFVYDPAIDKLYIVQARPIPAGMSKTIQPSSVPPTQIPTLNAYIKEGRIEKKSAAVITSAGFAAQLITRPEEILIFESISAALEHYLDLGQEDASQIKAVVVRQLAPPNSHEAAQFNLMGIPVLQVDQLSEVDNWSKTENLKLMIDPQRSQILNLSKYYLPPMTSSELRDALQTEELLVEGVFTHPVTPVTVLPLSINLDENSASPSALLGDRIKHQPQEVLTELHEKMQPVERTEHDRGHVYTQLLSNIDSLEAAPAGEPMLSLSKIRYALYRVARINNELETLFPQLMLLCDEIEGSLKRIADPSQNNADLRAEHLSLLAKLKSLVSFPGASNTFSHSIKQVMQEEKSRQSVDAAYYEGLDAEQADFMTEFLKLGKIGFNQEDKERWVHFVRDCVKHKEALPVLASVVKFYVDNQLESNLINADLKQAMDKNRPLKALKTLHDQCEQTKKEFYTFKLGEAKNRILAWEQRIPEWGNGAQFDDLWREYQKDMAHLITTLKIDDSQSMITQQSILNLVLLLADVMDKTNKSFKSSPDNMSKKQEVVVEQFARLLKPYYDLMSVWVMRIPDETIEKMYHKSSDGRSTNKQVMLDNMKSVLEKSNRTMQELSSSSQFSVASAKIGSGANFNRSFVNFKEQITLEDLFSLIHQNILSSVSIIKQINSPISLSTLPKELQPLFDAIKASKMDLLSVKHQFPVLALEFNYTMKNHSASFILEYDQNTQNVTLKGDVFGHNAENRMNILAQLINLDVEIFDVEQRQSAVYSQDKQCLTYAWTIPASRLEDVSVGIINHIKQYDWLITEINSNPRVLTDTYQTYVNTFISQNKFNLIHKIPNWQQCNDALNSSEIATKLESEEFVTNMIAQMNDPAMDPELIFFIVFKLAESLEDPDRFLSSLNVITSPTPETTMLLLKFMSGRGCTKGTFNLMINHIQQNQNYLRDNYGVTPLFIAAQQGYHLAVNLLKNKLPNEPVKYSVESLTHEFKDTESWTKVNELIQQQLNNGVRPDSILIYPMQIAEIMGHSVAAKYLEQITLPLISLSPESSAKDAESASEHKLGH